MSVLTSSWRRSLAAMAFVALASQISGDVAADDPLDGTMTVVLQDGEDGDRERGERERGDREAREREKDERREMEERERRENEEREHRRHMEELEGELRGLREKAEHIKREIGGRDPEEAPDLHHALREIHGRMEEIERHFHDGERDRKRRGVEERIGELKRRIAELNEAGRHDEAQRLEREAREMVERFKAAHRERPHRDRPRQEGSDEFQRRIGHIKVAIENLRAAGLHEPAERLAKEVERAIREHRERSGERGDRPHPEGPRTIHHMQEQINQMRGEMNEMRQLLKELVRQRRER